MVQLLTGFLAIAFYWVMGFAFLSQWLKQFHQDQGMTSQQRRFSLIILFVATLFWPIVVPISYLELLKSQRRDSFN